MSELQAGQRPAIVAQSPHVDAPASPPMIHVVGAPSTPASPPAPAAPAAPTAPPVEASSNAPAPTSGRIDRAQSTVKWFDPRKGFGFVVGPEGQDVFVHFSVIHGEGFKALKDNSRVEYDAVLADGRWKATRVIRLDGHDDGPEIHVVPRRNNPAPRSARR